MSALVLEGLTKAYGGTQTIRGIDLTVAAGEFVVLVGSSGCGKSTVLRMIAGLESVSGGRIRIGDRDVTRVPASDRGVAMVFQSYALYPHMTVAENLSFGLKNMKVGKAKIAEGVAHAAQILELDALLDRMPHQLSGGQRQRVAIGRAIVRDPEIFLFDEPLSNLDADLRVRMRHELAALHRRLGATMIYVTHDQVEAMTLANRVVVMNAGRIEQVGAPLALYDAPATLAVARAIGSPRMNLLPATIEAGGTDAVGVRLPSGAFVPVPVAGETGQPVTLGVRPEHLVADAAGPFTGAVELFERLGPLSFAHLGSPGMGSTIVAQLPGDRHIALGQTLAFRGIAERLHVFGEDGRVLPPLSP